MKKVIVAASAVMAMGMTTASAADLGAKMYKKAPPIVAAYDPWDVAFGASITNNYLFRGVSQSNNKPSVTAYFEPRFNVNKDLQLYIGTSASSISFTNRAALEIDGYFGIRPTFGAAAFDFGFWYYGYPGGECIDGVVGGGGVCPVGSNAVGPAFNVMKRDVSFYEGYAKFNYTFNDYFTMGVSDNYSPNFLNTGAWGNYAAVTAKAIAPSTWFGSSGVGMYASGEFGRQWLGTSDAFYGTGFTNPGFAGPFPGGTCFYGAPADTAGNPLGSQCATKFLANGNDMKKNVSFYEGYAKLNYTFNDYFSLGVNEYYSPNFLNTGAWGNYASVV
ncbi:MAG: TorF family putative porin, partial [Tardiphaga sp.]